LIGNAAENWAAAAALWAQQRQIQEQYQQNPVGARPPEPPGPPPDAPQPSSGDGSSVAVHDYNHGRVLEQQSQVFDYKHQNAAPQPPPADTDNHDSNIIDYNHGKNEEEPPHTTNDFQYNNNWNYTNQPAANWNENPYYQQQVQQNWNQNWNQENNFENENQQEQHENYHNNFNSERNSHQPSGFHRANSHNSKAYSDDHSGNNTPDPVDVNKKKALPLWLRDGLEKLEKDKKKDVKKVIPSAKNISGYQHGSPTSSPDRQEESDAELSDKADDSPVNNAPLSPSSIHHRKRSPSPEEDLSDEEKQRRLVRFFL